MIESHSWFITRERKRERERKCSQNKNVFKKNLHDSGFFPEVTSTSCYALFLFVIFSFFKYISGIIFSMKSFHCFCLDRGLAKSIRNYLFCRENNISKKKKKKDPYLYLHITGQFAQKMTAHRQPFNMVQWYRSNLWIASRFFFIMK